MNLIIKLYRKIFHVSDELFDAMQNLKAKEDYYMYLGKY